MRPNNILLIGGGGREHALAWKLTQSPNVNTIFVLPGNAGISFVPKVKCCHVKLPSSTTTEKDSNYAELIAFCKENEIGLVAIGPEEHLERGIVDALEKVQIHCFGPSQKAARLETSKAFAKSFLKNAGIPTARYETFTESAPAIKYIRTSPFKAYVVKASGLAAGKGVTVADSAIQACRAAVECLDEYKFCKAGNEIVVEELLEGAEISALAFTDGTTVKMMPFAQDHKRLLDKDKGPNTGGMGAYAPVLISAEHARIIEQDILQKSVQLMKEAETPYKGVLYAGIMITKDGPQVLEFNCRFGDPETQVLMRLLKSDLFDIMMHCASSTLHQCPVEWSTDDVVCGVVLASGGYPNSYRKDFPIKGLEHVEKYEKAAVVFHAGTILAKNTSQNANNELDEGDAQQPKFLTSGGRVLCVTASGCDLNRAYRNAYCACARIHFEKCHYRYDIGAKSMRSGNAPTYSSAGVNITEGNKVVQKIKPYCSRTNRPGCMGNIGSFGAPFDLKAAGYEDAILVSGTDGVGTKLKIAHITGIHETIGRDLVAMCVNDILVLNAEPLFFLDYFACGNLNVDQAAHVIRGIAYGCEKAGCALIGGETAEMPGFYETADYDLAGFAVGCVERKDKLPRLKNIKVGDVVLGLASSGVHSNGFSLVRKIIEDETTLRYTDQCPWTDSEVTIGDDLLTPTKIYVKSLLPVLRANLVNAAAHITGGGLVENIPRVLPQHLGVVLHASQWDVPNVFKWLAYTGDIDHQEMARTFNCGLGMVLLVPPENVATVKDMLEKVGKDEPGEKVYTIGSVVPISGDQKQVVINELDKILARRPIIPAPLKEKVRVAVLISGTGSNFKALFEHTFKTSTFCSIVCVVSNKADSKGLEYAMKVAKIAYSVLSHVGKSREAFDAELDEYLISQNVELVCLAGFMRILTAQFTEKWQGRMLNIHPSLLPSFKGSDAIKMALNAGVNVIGSTIHFVAAAVDSGAIVKQAAIEIKPGVDDEESVAERLKFSVEHKIYPQALEDLARCKVILNNEGRCIRRN